MIYAHVNNDRIDAEKALSSADCKASHTSISDKATKINTMVCDAIVQATTIRNYLIGMINTTDEATPPPIECLNDELDSIAGRLVRLNEILAVINSAF